jgi:phage baseplate assembly protein V
MADPPFLVKYELLDDGRRLRCRFATIQIRRPQMSQRNAVYTGVVVNSRDPRRLGRLRVSLPAFDQEVWARRATLVAGDRRGTWFVPDAGDEVLVAFEGGDSRRPIVVGALWNDKQRPPENNPERTLLRTKHGATIVFDDRTGSVEVTDSNGNAVQLTPAGITVTCAAKVTVSASEVEVSAGMLEVNAGMSTFSGVVKCDALITNSVVSSSYTPGAGNIW